MKEAFITICLVCGIIASALVLVTPLLSKQYHAGQRAEFAAWEKLTGNPSHLTLHEWLLLGGDRPLEYNKTIPHH